jgi:FkbM family methyltransferase
LGRLGGAARAAAGRTENALTRWTRPGSPGAAVLGRVAPPGSPLRRALAWVRRTTVARVADDPVPAFTRSFGQARPGAFFLQIGAHDGTQLDPLDEQIERRQWRGIMVEPIPEVFARLQARHRTNPRLVLENLALADEDGKREIFYLPQSSDPDLPPWYDALATFRRDVLAKHATWIPDIEQRIATLTVPCLTFDALCSRHGVERVDLIQIDTEGYDFEIIKQIDLARYRPTAVICEHIHMDPDTLGACLAHMSAAGYQHLRGALDVAFLRVGDLGPGDRRLRRDWDRLRAGSAPFDEAAG